MSLVIIYWLKLVVMRETSKVCRGSLCVIVIGAVLLYARSVIVVVGHVSQFLQLFQSVDQFLSPGQRCLYEPL